MTQKGKHPTVNAFFCNFKYMEGAHMEAHFANLLLPPQIQILVTPLADMQETAALKRAHQPISASAVGKIPVWAFG